MAFATHNDVATRLGRDLSGEEQNIATAVCEAVTELIAEAAGRDQAWIDNLDPVPRGLKQLCIEKAVMVIVNPEGAASVSKQLGSYQRSLTFPRSSDVGVFLSDEEAADVRRLVNRRRGRQASMRSIVDDLAELGHTGLPQA